MAKTISISLMAVCCWSCISSFTAVRVAGVELIQLNEKNFAALCPRGKESDAIYGDWVLRNQNIIAVIAAPKPGRNANMGVRNVGAMLLDFTQRSAQSDQLSCFYPAGAQYTFAEESSSLVTLDNRQLALTAQPRHEARALSVTFIGKPISGSDSEARVTYTLRDNDFALAYKVELTSKSDKPLDSLAQDSLRCDGPTFKFGQEVDSQLFWAEERFFHQAYGILPDQGKLVSEKDSRAMNLKHETGEGDSQLSVANANSRSWSGKVLCSQGLPGLRQMAQALDISTTTQDYQLKLNASDGPVEQAEVEFFADNKSLGLVNTDRAGWARMRLIPGQYTIKINAPAREARDHEFTLGPSVLSESLTLTSASRVRCRITDQAGVAIPAKLQFIGQGETDTPNFGPDTSEFGVRNLVYTANGIASQPLAAGKYAVIVSHGPEYDAVTEMLEVRPAQVVNLNIQLTRSVDSSGWVSGEFHSHSSPSGDNTSSQLGRVLNLLAENLEFAPCTEHNRIDSYEEHLTLLKATSLMATCTGMELTGQPLPVNHQNAFPLHRHPHEQDGGGPTTDANPVVQIQRLAMWDKGSDKVVQVNHPNIPQILGDRDLDNEIDEGFREMFDFTDVIEVHPLQSIFTPPTADVPSRERGQNRIFHWMQLLNLGYHVPGVVNTDAHYNWHGSGWLRNYIASSTDDPAKISTEEMTRVIQAGHMVMTTAPFLQVELRANVNGRDRTFVVGDHVALGDQPAKLWVRVQCANWYDVNRIQIFASGRPQEQLNFTRTSHPAMFHSGRVRFEAEINLPKFAQDTHLIVAAIGEGLKLGDVMGKDKGELPPVAVSNPIYVDVDGGKFKANGDNLGVPFMIRDTAAPAVDAPAADALKPASPSK